MGNDEAPMKIEDNDAEHFYPHLVPTASRKIFLWAGADRFSGSSAEFKTQSCSSEQWLAQPDKVSCVGRMQCKKSETE